MAKTFIGDGIFQGLQGGAELRRQIKEKSGSYMVRRLGQKREEEIGNRKGARLSRLETVRVWGDGVVVRAVRR
jgi:hypothetical protein